jgi:hypothetical protein
MTKPNERQAELIRSQTVNPNNNRALNPENWLVLEETEDKLIILSKRKRKRLEIEKRTTHD